VNPGPADSLTRLKIPQANQSVVLDQAVLACRVEDEWPSLGGEPEPKIPH
jgi:hypothetical protein